MYVCWTRGAHLATTKEAAVDMKGTGSRHPPLLSPPPPARTSDPPRLTGTLDPAAKFNQKLSLLCTMYQSSSGKFQEKMSKLAV